MKAVIFAGGVGTRLWPLSRKKSPKQFEKIIGDKSTLQLAVERLQPDFSWNDIYISTGRDYVPIIQSQLPKLSPDHVIGEPAVRDVGPAVGLATALLYHQTPDEPFAILWSDHLVKHQELFRKILMTAGRVLAKRPNSIVFVGQKPRFASVNLGWIDYGKSLLEENDLEFHALVDFQYRPDEKTAKKYFISGHHAWNLGYFIATPRYLWRQYQRFEPNLSTGLERIADAWHTGRFQDVLDDAYPTLEKVSFDNAILEKLDVGDGLVVSENIQWSDVGAWEALKEALEESKDKNVTQGKVALQDTKDSLVYNYTPQMVVTIDAEELLVINTSDVVLVCKKTSVSKIKKFVESLAGTEHEDLT
ncbi:NTP transferase domain-containing protein [Candidatus Gottesmanbacteria bacterium]|nr:NTP transferase domain-containing protein [Candidatus Gottesmanbacteria bacterium]